MPCRNSSGKVASEASSTPSARSPFEVNATVTQRLSCATDSRIAFAECTFSRIAASHARPPAGSLNDKNSYRPFSAGARVNRMCWMSSRSSMARQRGLLHLGELRLHAQRLLDFVGAYEWILAVFEETRTLVVAHELNECRRVGLPVF